MTTRAAATPAPPRTRAADGERIEAARFAPTGAKAGRRMAPFTGRRLVALGLVAVGVAAAWFLWFLFTAKSVRFELTPPGAELALDTALAISLGETHLLRRGRYRARVSAPGHAPLERVVRIGAERQQTVVLALERLPGLVTFDIDPPGALVEVTGTDVRGVAPLQARLPAGQQTAAVSGERYQPASVTFQVEGMERPQVVTVALAPNWADITIPTSPPGAAVFVDDQPTGAVTPGPVPILAGDRRVAVKLSGYNRWIDILRVAAGERRELPTITLTRADGLLRVTSNPANATVILNRAYVGETPLEVNARPGRNHRLNVFKVGHAPHESVVKVTAGAERALHVTLPILHGKLVVTASPEDAELWLNGQPQGVATGARKLPAAPHEVEIKRAGHASYRKTIWPLPGFAQELKVRLLTLEAARLAALKQARATAQGQELVLLEPGTIRMGASRREPGRRANEVLRAVQLTRLFYLGRHEVTNAEYRVFQPQHDSGKFETFNLNAPEQPVVNVSWQDAARYCNWLSAQDGLQPFYQESDGTITGFSANALGYRLPTEAEWAWAARTRPDAAEPLRFAWGDQLPPPDRHGNYADRSATHLVGRVIFGYNDNHNVSAPVGTFAANAHGIYDLGGNVAEWTHDFYDTPSATEALDPLGPKTGRHRVIRGASWMRGTVTDLRLAYRDYGTEGRTDVGFRLARFAE